MSETSSNPTDRPSELLFSYGTLRLEPVQLKTFGRVLDGFEDQLEGFNLTMIEIKDAEVVATSGKARHPILMATGQTEDRVAGSVFYVTPDELARADDYEVDAYRREKVKLVSGKIAWAYVDAEPSGFAPDGTM